MPIRVFVYGTLKKDKGNHGLLSGSKFLGRCYLMGEHRLVSLGGYPALVEKFGIEPVPVVGEVYQVDERTLQSLDWLEGHPRYYERRKVATPWKNAWAYYLPQDYLDKYPVVGASWRPSNEEIEWAKGMDDLKEIVACGS